METTKTIKKNKKEEKKEQSEVKILENFDKEKIEEMLKLGLHFGHSHKKKNPKMDPYLYGMRNNIDIIDLLETEKQLNIVLDYLKEIKAKKPLILFVGTKPSAKKIVMELAQKLSMPYVIERWLGGTLTNFESIKRRVEFLKEMEKKKQEGEFEKYTKQERLRIEKEIERTEKKLGGLKNLERLPDILFVVDANKEKIAIKEAKRKNICVIALCDSDGDPTSVDYFIPVNDEGISSLKYIFDKVEKALL